MCAQSDHIHLDCAPGTQVIVDRSKLGKQPTAPRWDYSKQTGVWAHAVCVWLQDMICQYTLQCARPCCAPYTDMSMCCRFGSRKDSGTSPHLDSAEESSSTRSGSEGRREIGTLRSRNREPVGSTMLVLSVLALARRLPVHIDVWLECGAPVQMRLVECGA